MQIITFSAIFLPTCLQGNPWSVNCSNLTKEIRGINYCYHYQADPGKAKLAHQLKLSKGSSWHIFHCMPVGEVNWIILPTHYSTSWITGLPLPAISHLCKNRNDNPWVPHPIQEFDDWLGLPTQKTKEPCTKMFPIPNAHKQSPQSITVDDI